MAERYRLVLVGDSDDAMTQMIQEHAEMRLSLAKIQFGASNQIHTLVLYDSTVQKQVDFQESCLKVAAAIGHQDANNCLFTLMPQLQAPLATEMVMKHTRILEDRLMAAAFDLGGDLAITYGVTEEHGNERRRTSQRARLCLSKAFVESSPWGHSLAQRGTIHGLPMLRYKDMVCPIVDPGDHDKKPSPAGRLLQRGVPACTEMLQQLLSGVPLQKGDKVIIVDLTGNFTAEWALTAFKSSQSSNAEKYMVAYLGAFVCKKEFFCAQGTLKGALMTESWDVSGGGAEDPSEGWRRFEPAELAIGILVPSLGEAKDSACGVGQVHRGRVPRSGGRVESAHGAALRKVRSHAGRCGPVLGRRAGLRVRVASASLQVCSCGSSEGGAG